MAAIGAGLAGDADRTRRYLGDRRGVGEVSYQPSVKVNTPRQLGPTMRMPLVRAISAISAWAGAVIILFGETGGETTAERTPKSAYSRIVSMAMAAGTEITALSGTSGKWILAALGPGRSRGWC